MAEIGQRIDELESMISTQKDEWQKECGNKIGTIMEEATSLENRLSEITERICAINLDLKWGPSERNEPIEALEECKSVQA